MAILPVLRYPNPALRTKCEPVTEMTDKIRELLDDLTDTMFAWGAHGLAAPQVGIPLRLAVVAVPTFSPESPTGALWLINPTVVAEGKATIEPEGCLSFPGVFVPVERRPRVRMEFGLGIDDVRCTAEWQGLQARAALHEIDHLNGVLLVDHVGLAKRRSIERQMDKFKPTLIPPPQDS